MYWVSLSLIVLWLCQGSRVGALQNLLVSPATPPGATEDRRKFISCVSAFGVSLALPSVSYATQSQETKDKANILKGYERLNYLLDNWEQETTICKTGSDRFEGRCERTPLRVMGYMGYKNVEDPLFRAEKTMARLQALVPASKDAEYLEAVENFLEQADEASGMAYISSWGEANPGGGKDRVEYFIERSKKNVIIARDSLATVINILGLQP